MNDNNTYIDSLVNTLKDILKSRDFDIKDEDVDAFIDRLDKNWKQYFCHYFGLYILLRFC